MEEALEKRIDAIMRQNLPQLERWEITRIIEPISAMNSSGKLVLNLTIVVDEKSYFTLNGKVSRPDKKDSSIEALIEAIEKTELSLKFY